MFTKLFDKDQPGELTEATLTINGKTSTYTEVNEGVMLSRDGKNLALFRRTNNGFEAEKVENSSLNEDKWSCYYKCLEECRAAGRSPCAGECDAKCF